MNEPTRISEVIPLSPGDLDIGVRLDLNPSVTPEDEDRLHAQAHTILERLKRGPISNVNMADISMQYNARVFELRRMLEPKGFTVSIIQKQADGVNIYGIVEGVNRKVFRKAKQITDGRGQMSEKKKKATESARCKASQAGHDLQACRRQPKKVNKKQLTFNF